MVDSLVFNLYTAIGCEMKRPWTLGVINKKNNGSRKVQRRI